MIIRLWVTASLMMLITVAQGRADIEKWYILGQDGCSEFVFLHNTQYGYWQLWYHCCGSTIWCYDDGVV